MGSARLSAVDEIQAAITEIERLKSESVKGPWHVGDANGGDPHEFGPLWVIGHELVSLNRADGEPPEEWWMELQTGRLEDAQLIVTLHRTIDAQLAILRDFLTVTVKDDALLKGALIADDFIGTPSAPLMALARAINGTS